MARIAVLAFLVLGLGSVVVLTQNGTEFSSFAKGKGRKPVPITTPPPVGGQYCYTDADCEKFDLLCPQVVGQDTLVCDQNTHKCYCGSR